MTPETRIGGNQVDVSLGPWPPGLVRSPFVRADVTRLEEPLHQNSPREDRRPLRAFPLPAKNQLNAGCPKLGMLRAFETARNTEATGTHMLHFFLELEQPPQK
jgi:hypothetical protein